MLAYLAHESFAQRSTLDRLEVIRLDVIPSRQFFCLLLEQSIVVLRLLLLKLGFLVRLLLSLHEVDELKPVLRRLALGFHLLLPSHDVFGDVDEVGSCSKVQAVPLHSHDLLRDVRWELWRHQ